ncbi:MAG TPA: hypothetical protein VK789_32925 [Bryobacteraceae bacterium]|nr:hypothetical protein [Bryobacteraceae bacterium]
MAAKRTLKYKRNRLPPIVEIIDDAIQYCLRAIEKPGYKGTMSDLIRLIRFSRELHPIKREPTKFIWVDTPQPT